MSRLLVVAGLLAFSHQADAQFRVIEEAYEVRLSDFQVPTSDFRKATFRECTDCKLHAIYVTDATRWIIDGITVSLDVFRKRTSSVTNRDNTVLTVMHHLENNRISRVEVRLR